MRSVYLIRSHKALLAALTAVCLAAAVPALAVSIKSPTEGRMVRDKVTIIVPKSSLPTGAGTSGFLVLKVDGHFVCANAADGSDMPGQPVADDVTVLWDTKQPIMDPKLPADQREYIDGHHELVIEVHGPKDRGKDILLESTKVGVVLQNQVPRPNPAPPLKLRYRFHIDQENQFRIRTSGELLNKDGDSLTGGHMPILGEFSVVQSVEDVQPDGAAMLRYKVDKDAFSEVFRKVTMLGQVGPKFRSVYKIVSNTGKILKPNVLSLKSDIRVTDCLVEVPPRLVQVGESWPCSFTLKIEGLSEPVTLTGQSTLAGVEWDGGYECAKIVSTMSGSPVFTFLNDQAGSVEAKGVAYFSYKAGKMIENNITMEFKTLLDQATISTMQQETSLSSETGTGAGPIPSGASGAGNYPGGPGAMPTPGQGGSSQDMARRGYLPNTAGVPSTYGSPGSSASSTSSGSSGGSDADKTPVIIRLVVSTQLQR